MKLSSAPSQRVAMMVCGVVLAAGLGVGAAAAADYGRLAGSVYDTEGNPLMGATVMVMGPLFDAQQGAQPVVERIVTDARGKFVLGRLVPGFYSLRVFSPTRLPAARNRVRVDAGRTADEKFVLGDIFAPLRIQAPATNLSTWGDDWKWILRTSARTRPVLRYQQTAKADVKPARQPLPSSQRLIGVIPGSASRDGLTADAGLGSVLAYFRALSEDSDMLVAGSMMADGSQASTLATAFRKNLMKGDPQVFTLTVHQLSFAEGVPLPGGDDRESLSHAQAFVVSYANTRRVTEAMSVTAGFEVDYLTAAMDAMAARPHAKVEYRISPSSTMALRYGSIRPEGEGTLLERVGELNAFPRVTLLDSRLQLEKVNHAEVSYDRQLGANTRVEIATYRDSFQNTAVWGLGDVESVRLLAGNILPNPAAGGVTLNGGNYASSGVRVAVVHKLGRGAEALFLYSSGEGLAVDQAALDTLEADGRLRYFLTKRATQVLAGKFTARIPASRTRITTSYEWLPEGMVNGIDPYGQANSGIQPFLNMQIRQPLPTLGFFPARIEAIADFRNLLAEGYIPLSRSDDRLLLTPAYRSFRGGFSVEF